MYTNADFVKKIKIVRIFDKNIGKFYYYRRRYIYNRKIRRSKVINLGSSTETDYKLFLNLRKMKKEENQSAKQNYRKKRN